MEFYKKNPEIPYSITVQGKMLDDDTVVCGDEFRVFADPMTFPGKPVKLVRVELSELSDSQKKDLQAFMIAQKMKPPKHLGAVTSETMGSPKTDRTPDGVEKKPTRVVEVKVSKSKKTESEDTQPMEIPAEIKEKASLTPPPKTLPEMYSPQELIELFPGVTEVNAKRVLRSDLTLKGLATASNADLRKLGISPSFYGRLRDKAEEILKEVE